MKKFYLALIVLALSMLACSMQDLRNLNAAVHGLKTSSPTPTETTGLLQAQTGEKPGHIIQINEDKNSAFVCTGNPDGHLRVRAAPGTDAAEIALLAEGSIVRIGEREQQADGSTWAATHSPTGWVNARYLCDEQQAKGPLR
jgi:hypothetical protein